MNLRGEPNGGYFGGGGGKGDPPPHVQIGDPDGWVEGQWYEERFERGVGGYYIPSSVADPESGTVPGTYARYHGNDTFEVRGYGSSTPGAPVEEQFYESVTQNEEDGTWQTRRYYPPGQPPESVPANAVVEESDDGATLVLFNNDGSPWKGAGGGQGEVEGEGVDEGEGEGIDEGDGGGFGGGGEDNCLVLGTLVHLTNGSARAIEELQPGDEIISFDRASRTAGPAVVLAVDEYYASETIILAFDSGEVEVTPPHRLLSLLHGKMTPVSALRPSDRIKRMNGPPETVIAVRRIAQKRRVLMPRLRGGVGLMVGPMALRSMAMKNDP